MAAPQPRFLTWSLAVVATSWLVTGLDGFMGTLAPSYARLVRANPTMYQFSFWAVQLIAVCAIAVYLSRKFPMALWVPTVSLVERWRGSLLIVLPLTCFYLWRLVSAYSSIHLLAHQHGKAGLIALFERVWSHLPSGSSWPGIVLYSLLSILGPVAETILFSGLLANKVGRRLRPVIAILLVAVVTVVAHLPAYGLTHELAVLFLSAATYTAVRFYSGSLWSAVVAHVIVNVIVMLPKWILAIVRLML